MSCWMKSSAEAREREADLKEIGRWKSDTMVRRYSKTGKRARAFEAFQLHNPLG